MLHILQIPGLNLRMETSYSEWRLCGFPHSHCLGRASIWSITTSFHVTSCYSVIIVSLDGIEYVLLIALLNEPYVNVILWRVTLLKILWLWFKICWKGVCCPQFNPTGRPNPQAIKMIYHDVMVLIYHWPAASQEEMNDYQMYVLKVQSPPCTVVIMFTICSFLTAWEELYCLLECVYILYIFMTEI
jgi:hypothetical protein